MALTLSSDMRGIDLGKVLTVERDGFVMLPRKTKPPKKVALNLNVYRNQYHHEISDCKIQVKKDTMDFLKQTGQDKIKFTKEVKVSFQVFKKTKRKMDKGNVYSVVTKYVYDALVELGVITDDNDDHIKTETILPTVHDKDNPRVVLIFEEI